MFSRLLLVACLSGTAVAQTVSPCSNVHVGAVSPAIPLPALPAVAFKAVVRAVILNKNKTVDATEYVDEKYNAAAMHFNDQGHQIQIIMHYSTDEAFYIGPNPLKTSGGQFCETKNLTTDDNTQLFGLNGDTSQGVPHLYSTQKILSFINGTEVYKGQTVMDGIKVNRWSSCMYWPHMNANFSLDYYFSVPGWQTPSGVDQVPVRAQIQGTRHYTNGTVTNFNHIYQYINFEYYVDDPEGVFETPPGVYCIFRQKVKPVPQLKNHFYYREEITDMGVSNGGYVSISESDIWYDFDLQLLRYDTRDQPDGVSRIFTSRGPFTVIHDYAVGVQYTIDRYARLCSMDPIPYSARGFDAVNNITSRTLTMRNPKRFFNLDDASYLYAGQRKARGVLCDVFQAVITSLPNRGVVIYEVYFLTSQTSDITDRGSAGIQPTAATPVRILEWEDNTLINEYNIHNFDQDSSTYDKFDVSVCFPGTHSKDFELFMSMSPKGTNSVQMMPILGPVLDALIHMNMALSVAITPVRIQNSRMHWDRNNVYYQATLLDAAPSIAKYEIWAGKNMASTAGKPLHNIAMKYTCAQACDQLQEWSCKEFDYCPSTKTCTLAKASPTLTSPSALRNSTQCDHYTRVLGGRFDTQTSLSTAWLKLSNQVYQQQIFFELPLPDASGNVDLTVDPSTLDPSQKIVFTAFKINDQVISSSQVQRNPTSNLALSQFASIPRRIGKGFGTTIRGISVDECAKDCVGEQTYTCQSFHYCWEAGTCFLSRNHPDERPDMLRYEKACDTYFRNYSSNYQLFSGVTVLSASDTIYQNVISPNQCAKLCTYYKSFHCESFDYCTDVNTCFLGRTHYYDAPKANVKQSPTCSHYSRNYLADFVSKAHKMVALRDNRVIQSVNPQQCARLCAQEKTFTCNSFDYCGNYSECRLSDASVANTGQVTLEATAYCDVYQRQFGSGAAAQSSNSNNGKYSGAALGGIAIAMIVIGVIIGVVAIMLFTKFRGGGADGMNIAFTRHQETDS